MVFINHSLELTCQPDRSFGHTRPMVISQSDCRCVNWSTNGSRGTKCLIRIGPPCWKRSCFATSSRSLGLYAVTVLHSPGTDFQFEALAEAGNHNPIIQLIFYTIGAYFWRSHRNSTIPSSIPSRRTPAELGSYTTFPRIRPSERTPGSSGRREGWIH